MPGGALEGDSLLRGGLQRVKRAVLSSVNQRGMSDAAAVEVCLVNIGPRERAKRLKFGVMALAVGLLATAALVATGAGRGWRGLLFLPFFAAGLGYFQARRKT